MLDAAAGLASGYFEYFKNTRELDRSTEAMQHRSAAYLR
jgi:hypothetical protein